MGVHFDTQFRNPLAYPAGYRPGFDPSHAAATKIRFSGVPSGANFVNLLSGIVSTIVGSPTGSIDGQIGIVGNPVSNTGYFSFTGQPTTTDAGFTYAVIGTLSTVAAFTSLFQTTFAGVPQTYINATGKFGIFKSRGDDSAITVTANTPYFLAVSYTGGTGGANFVVKNLATGEIKTDVVNAGAAPGAWGGTFIIGGQAGGASSNWKCAAAMCNGTFMSIPALVQWAADPWSFWYPNPGDNYFGVSASGFPWWGVQNNNFVIGTGVQ